MGKRDLWEQGRGWFPESDSQRTLLPAADDKASGEVACSLDPPAWDGSHSAPEDTSHEDGQASAGEDDSESSGDESLDEEEGESTGEAATRKAKAPRAQRFKGRVPQCPAGCLQDGPVGS